MPGPGLLVPFPFAVSALVPLVSGQPGQVHPLQDPPDAGLADLDIVVPLEVHGDLRRAEVVRRAQVDNLGDDLRRVSCGQCAGRLDRSRSPATPSVSYRRNQV